MPVPVMIQGKPLGALPADLYIPPEALEILLEHFQGPLDVLLYFIKKKNIDILDIPMVEITRQYMGYIETLQTLKLDLAGEYLVMAATLIDIKSRCLLPPAPKENTDSEEDPRAELARKLQAYETIKQAAQALDTLPRCERDRFRASIGLSEKDFPRPLPAITLSTLLQAWRDVLQRQVFCAHHTVVAENETLSVEKRMQHVWVILRKASSTSREGIAFHCFLWPHEAKKGVVVTFSALLELIRQKRAEVSQDFSYGPLYFRPLA